MVVRVQAPFHPVGLREQRRGAAAIASLEPLIPLHPDVPHPNPTPTPPQPHDPSDPEELAEYRLRKRKEFEDLLRRVGKWQPGVWVKVRWCWCVCGGGRGASKNGGAGHLGSVAVSKQGALFQPE